MKLRRFMAIVTAAALAVVVLCFWVFKYVPAYGGAVPSPTHTPYVYSPKSYSATSTAPPLPMTIVPMPPSPTPPPTIPTPTPTPIPTPTPTPQSTLSPTPPPEDKPPETTPSQAPKEEVSPSPTSVPEAPAPITPPPPSPSPNAPVTPTPEFPPEELSSEPVASREEEEQEAAKTLEMLGENPEPAETPAEPPSDAVLSLPEREYVFAPFESRYNVFAEQHPDIPFSQIAAYVNVNADYGYYNHITINESPHDLWVLCNKNYQLSKDFIPDNLRKVVGTKYLLRSDAADSFEQMAADMAAENLKIVVYSAYRSYDYQKNLYNRYVNRDGVERADTYSARAGHSEHQTGLAIDFLHKGGMSSMSAGNFQDTKQYQWLLENAHRYGFILRYPSNYVWITGYKFEPWHWRYIGAEAATLMHENDIHVFEEFWGRYLSDTP